MKLVDDILVLLREPEIRRANADINRLVMSQMELTKTDLPGFLYRGIQYRHTGCPKGKIQFQSLEPALYPDMEYHLANQRSTAVDLQVVRQVILSLVQDCIDFQDVRDALPECLVRTVGSSELNRLDRTRDPGWNLDPNSRAYRQYLKYLPKMEFFAAARLMY